MFSLDPRPDKFRTRLPQEFLEASIVSRYDQILGQKPYLFDKFESVINESIQSFELPLFGYTAATQRSNQSSGGSIETVSVPGQSIQNTIDNTFTITFRHSEAYLTYWFMVEHYFKKYKLGPDSNRAPMPALLLEMLDYRDNTVALINFKNVLFTGVDGLSLSYNSIDRTPSTFTASFAYSEFIPQFNIPSLKTY